MARSARKPLDCGKRHASLCSDSPVPGSPRPARPQPGWSCPCAVTCPRHKTSLRRTPQAVRRMPDGRPSRFSRPVMSATHAPARILRCPELSEQASIGMFIWKGKR